MTSPQAALVSCNVTSDVNEVLQFDFPSADPILLFELRCAATLTLLSLLEGCNDASRPKHMVNTICFASVKRILDSLWDMLRDAVQSGYKLPDDQQALLDLAFNLFILMYQLSTFSDDQVMPDARAYASLAPFPRPCRGLVRGCGGRAVLKNSFFSPC